MDSSPPPAPANAWAMLSPCCAVDEGGIGASDWVFDVVLDMIVSDAAMCELQESERSGEMDIYHMEGSMRGFLSRGSALRTNAGVS